MKKTYNHSRIIIWAVALWIYGLTVFRVQDDDFPLPLVAIVTFLPILGLYFYLAKKEVADGSKATKPAARGGLVGQYNFRIRDVFESFVAVILAVVLAIATVALFFDPSLKRELSSPWVNCARDASKITTLPVEKTLDYTNAKITVHNVTYNVPQNSEHPTAYSYECEKATLVEVTIAPKADTEDIDMIDFSLDNKDQEQYAWSSHPDDVDEYKYYADDKKLTFIDSLASDDSAEIRGWLVFSVREDNSNDGSTLTYGEYADDKKPSIVLPEPTE